jgi:restriction system protein
MAVPDYQSLMLPLLNIAGDGNEHSLNEAIERLAQQIGLSEIDRNELLPSGMQRKFESEQRTSCSERNLSHVNRRQQGSRTSCH